jgi:glycerol kinase
VWRGAIEAVANEVDALIAHVDAVVGPHTRLVVTGGWARDAAVLEAKRRRGAIETSLVSEAGCRGAALLSGVAAGLYPSADDLPAISASAKEPV